VERFKKLERTHSEETCITSLDLYQRNSIAAENAVAQDSEIVPCEAPCKAARYLLVGTTPKDGLHEHFKTFCKSYRCPFCGPRKVFQVRLAITEAMSRFKLDKFLTLTLDPADCAADGSVAYIRNCWNKFRNAQKKEFGKNVDFISVVELQKSGYAHLHILMNQYTPYAWIKSAWQSVGGGQIVWIKLADLGTAKYLAKYIGKQMLESKTKVRFYSTSQSIKLREMIKRNSDMKFEFAKASEAEGRNILFSYIKSDITDRKGHILGFRSSRPLRVSGGSQRNLTLEGN
jgi:hypothetical protein